MISKLWENLLVIVLGAGVSGLLSKISTLTKRIETDRQAREEHYLDEEKEQELLKQLVLLSEGKAFLTDCGNYISHGYIAIEELKYMTERFELLHSLGFDGVGTESFRRVKELKISGDSAKE